MICVAKICCPAWFEEYGAVEWLYCLVGGACCSVLLWTVVCCSVLQHTVCCSVQCAAARSVLQRATVRCREVCCSVLQCAAVCCSVLQHAAFCSVGSAVCCRVKKMSPSASRKKSIGCPAWFFAGRKNVTIRVAQVESRSAVLPG